MFSKTGIATRDTLSPCIINFTAWYVSSPSMPLHMLTIIKSILTTSMGTSREDWKAMDPKIREHRSHCVEYLRQSIICNADTTLEGETGAWATSTGWGQTHSCVNFDALTEWADKRAIWDLSEELLPQSFDPLRVVVGNDGEVKPADKK